MEGQGDPDGYGQWPEDPTGLWRPVEDDHQEIRKDERPYLEAIHGWTFKTNNLKYLKSALYS